MSKERKILGRYGEDMAKQYLLDHSYKFLEANLNLKFGEIDLLMRDGKTLVIIEVKTKNNLKFGLPQEMVGPQKQHKLRLLAKALEQTYPGNPVRIDVVAIDESNQTLEHIINAVEGE